MESSTSTLGTGSFLYKGCPVSFVLLSCFVEISGLNTNSVDPDQMPHSAASDLGYSVCQCPFYGMLGLNRLICKILCTCVYI